MLTYITTSNLYWDRFDLSVLKEMPFTEQEVDKCTAKKGDLLVCEGGDIGRAAIWSNEKDIRIQNHIHRLRGLGHICNRLFLFWLMYLKSKSLIGGRGIGLMGLSSGELDRLVVPLPPLKEQFSIVNRIDVLFGAVSDLENEKASLNDLVTTSKSKILDLAIQGKLAPQDTSDEPAIELLKRINPYFRPSDNLHYEGKTPDGWTLCMLGEASDYGRCTSVPVDDINDDEWVLELEDIEKDSGRILHRLAKKDRAISGIRHRFKKGQVLYSKLRTYLNKVLVASEDGYCTTEIIPITPINGITPQYLCFVLRSPYFLDYTARCGYGVKMPRLGTNDAKRAIIPIPPITEQSRIVNKTEVLLSELERIVALDSIQLTE